MKIKDFENQLEKVKTKLENAILAIRTSHTGNQWPELSWLLKTFILVNVFSQPLKKKNILKLWVF